MHENFSLVRVKKTSSWCITNAWIPNTTNPSWCKVQGARFSQPVKAHNQPMIAHKKKQNNNLDNDVFTLKNLNVGTDLMAAI